ncbi:MAG: Zn-dependent hydrolase [Gammaproteobacteria bacterium]
MSTAAIIAVGGSGCASRPAESPDESRAQAVETGPGDRLSRDWQRPKFVSVRLEGSVSLLTARQRQMLDELINAASAIDDIFWEQTYGDRTPLLEGLEDPVRRRLVKANYGPWDRFRGNTPILANTGPKPRGGRFYPSDMSPEEFASVDMAGIRQPHTVVRRAANGGLVAVPFSEAYRPALERAARHMASAAFVCDDPFFKRYLTLRARALITDDYGPSDRAWAELRSNIVDLVIGPLDRQEDDLFGLKSAFAAWVLLRDRPGSDRMDRVSRRLPEIAQSLPFATAYEQGRSPVSGFGIYDALYLAGAANAGPKPGTRYIDEAGAVHGETGAVPIYLRNIMYARFSVYTLPIGREMIARDQRSQIRFGAHLDNVLFGDLGKSLGPAEQAHGKTSLQMALKEHAAEIDQAKAGALGAYIIGWLHERGDPAVSGIESHMVTLVAGILEDIYRNASSPLGQARILQFNYLKAFGGITREASTGEYRIHSGKAREALASLATQLMFVQGNRDYEAAGRLLQDMGGMDLLLREDMKRLSGLELPVGIIFEQGLDVLEPA